MRPTQILQYLKRIVWNDPSVYSTNPAMRLVAEQAVKAHYDQKRLEERGAEEAAIRGSFHSTVEDSEEHLTVDWKRGDGSHVTTHHVKK